MSEASVLNIVVVSGLAMVAVVLTILMTKLVSIHKSFKRLNRSTREKVLEWDSLRKQKDYAPADSRMGSTPEFVDSLRKVLPSAERSGRTTFHREGESPEINFPEFIEYNAALIAGEMSSNRYVPDLIAAGTGAHDRACEEYDDKRHGNRQWYLIHHILEAVHAERDRILSPPQILEEQGISSTFGGADPYPFPAVEQITIKSD